MKIRQRFDSDTGLINAIRRVSSSRPDLKTYYVNTSVGELIDLDPVSTFRFSTTFSPIKHGRALYEFLNLEMMRGDWTTPRSYRYDCYQYLNPETNQYENPQDSEYRRFYDLVKFHNFVYNTEDFVFPFNMTSYRNTREFRVHPGTYRELALMYYWQHRPETRLVLMTTDVDRERKWLVSQMQKVFGDRVHCIDETPNGQLTLDFGVVEIAKRNTNIEVSYKTAPDGRFDGFCIVELHSEQMIEESQFIFEVEYKPETGIFTVNGDTILRPYKDQGIEQYRLTQWR